MFCLVRTWTLSTLVLEFIMQSLEFPPNNAANYEALKWQSAGAGAAYCHQTMGSPLVMTVRSSDVHAQLLLLLLFEPNSV